MSRTRPWKIAISGTHGAGKTTLAHAVIERLPGFAFVEEPYHTLARDGHEVSDVPTVDDFAEQLDASVAAIAAATSDTIFDRSPLDFLAYALSLKDRDPIDVPAWIRTAREGLRQLDLIVLCPLEAPDRIQVPAGDDRRLRTAVDRRLKESVLDDSYGVLSQVAVLEVQGDLEQRARRVLSEIERLQQAASEVT